MHLKFFQVSCVNLYIENKTSEQQFNNIRKLQSLVKEIRIIIKMCADLNRNRFLLQCQVHNNACNKLELTGVFL